MTQQAGDSDLRLGYVARDETITVVGYCQPSSDLPSPAPHVFTNERELEPVGGDLQQIGADWFNFFYYPPTADTRLRVEHDGAILGEATFDEAPAVDRCAVRASAPFEVLACDAVVTLRWQTKIPWSADRIELLDVEVIDETTRKPLGFYQFDFDDARDGLVVTFGTMRPADDRVLVRPRYAYLDVPGRKHPVEKAFPRRRPVPLDLRPDRRT